jgi:hypothetical protein
MNITCGKKLETQQATHVLSNLCNKNRVEHQYKWHLKGVSKRLNNEFPEMAED